MQRILTTVCVLFPLTGAAPAQDLALADALRSSAGLQREDGRLLGIGYGYKAWLDRDGVAFVPALGRLAPREFPLRLVTTGIGRASAVSAVAPVEPGMDGRTARYRRGAVEERYEMRPEGMEQSFLFHTLPAGDGDLVVRCTLQCELPAEVDGEGLRFSAPGIGGVSIGAVTGIDADGRTARGALRLDGNVLELSLPEDFVESARFPLVLDPLIGTVRHVVSQGVDFLSCDAAYDDTTGTYLVVCQLFFSALDSDIHAVKMDANGGNVVLLSLESGGGAALSPVVANVTSRDAFAVVWLSLASRDLVGRTVAAASGSLSPTVTVHAGTVGGFDIGGEATDFDDDAIVVWAEGGDIFAKQVSITPSLGLSPFPTVIGIGNTVDDDRAPSISKSGGRAGRYCIAWERRINNSRPAIRAAVVTRNLAIEDDFVPITGTAVSHERPVVDGDGDHWVIAYAKAESTASSPDFDVFCRTVEYAAGNPAGNRGRPGPAEIALENDANDPEYPGDVAWLGESVLVVYADRDNGTERVFAKSIDPFDCEPCEGEFLVQDTRFTTSRPDMAVAAQRSGNASRTADLDQAMLAWSSLANTQFTTAGLHWTRFRGDDGENRRVLGGGCGQGGTAHGSCARAGNASFDLRLFGAAPNVAAFAVVGEGAGFGFACGGCRLNVDPYTGFVAGPFMTSSGGSAAASFAIPPIPALLPSGGFHAQWAVAAPSPICGALGVDLSDTLTVIIQP